MNNSLQPAASGREPRVRRPAPAGLRARRDRPRPEAAGSRRLDRDGRARALPGEAAQAAGLAGRGQEPLHVEAHQ